MDYLTEASLGVFLRERLSDDFIHNKAMPGRRYRPDYRSERHKLVVEFDGYLHYQSAKTVFSDEVNTRDMEQMGYKVVRIPYFVQLDSATIRYYFEELVEDDSPFLAYRHGFRDEKALLPADFCELGVRRFLDVVDDLPVTVGDEIRQSLTARIGELSVDSLAPTRRSYPVWQVIVPPSAFSFCYPVAS